MVNEKLREYIKALNPSEISIERREILKGLIDYIQAKLNTEDEIQLNFICTHNSRRSHFAQIWAQTLASYFNIPNIHCYSAGTEATALFPMVINTLKDAGFHIKTHVQGHNPIYHIYYAASQDPIIGFSKTIADEYNPTSNFAAVMTCNDADQNCPFVPGASHRISLPYKDPKVYDGSNLQSKKYAERCFQIASELYYVYTKIKL